MNLLRSLYAAWCDRARIRAGYDQKGRGPEYWRGWADRGLADWAEAGKPTVTVTVTGAEVEAAKLLVERAHEKGEPVAPAIALIAEACRRHPS